MKITWTWTNWTFGIWWGRIGKRFMWGVEFGPLEFIHRKKIKKDFNKEYRAYLESNPQRPVGSIDPEQAKRQEKSLATITQQLEYYQKAQQKELSEEPFLFKGKIH